MSQAVGEGERSGAFNFDTNSFYGGTREAVGDRSADSEGIGGSQSGEGMEDSRYEKQEQEFWGCPVVFHFHEFWFNVFLLYRCSR